LFLSNSRTNSTADTNARDVAIIFSFAVQHGADPEAIRRALCRNADGSGSGPLGAALDIIAGVRLGPGKISVNPAKLGVVGHGFGGSAAVFAAAGMADGLKAAVAVFPTVSSPAAEQPAAGLRVPGMILTTPDQATSIRSNAASLSKAWRQATLRTVAKAEPGGLVEGFRLTRVVGLPAADRRTQKVVRALLTGYLLNMLTGDKTYKDFSDPEVTLPKTVAPDPEAPPITPEDKVVALLKG